MSKNENLIYMNELMMSLHEGSLRLYQISDPIHEDVMNMEASFCNELSKIKKIHEELMNKCVQQQIMDVAERLSKDGIND